MAKMRTRRGRNGPLDDYNLDENWWQSSDVKTARPAVGGAVYGTNDTPVVVKQWPRKKNVEDAVLREIWHDEVRQLNRLKGLPRASAFLATIRDSFEDEFAFTLILDCGDRVPLAERIGTGRGRGWLAAPRSLGSRIRLWAEVRRLSCAIGILHGQGLLHRNIDASAVMTGGEGEADFLLTGFEWSMRLISSASPRRSRSEGAVHSFYEDWRALGHLLAQVLQIPSSSKPGERYRTDPSANIDFLTGPEKDLLRTLIAADPLSRLDADVVAEQLDLITPTLDQQRQGTDPKLVLALRLDEMGDLSKALRRISGMTISLTDYEGQKRLVREALLERPTLVKISSKGGLDQYQLSCARFVLPVTAMAASRGGEATWSVAECRTLLGELPPAALVEGTARRVGGRGHRRRRRAAQDTETSGEDHEMGRGDPITDQRSSSHGRREGWAVCSGDLGPSHRHAVACHTDLAGAKNIVGGRRIDGPFEGRRSG